ncbi:MAG: hypothetical protein AABW81_02580 [Nanoarchaeota archaeon]
MNTIRLNCIINEKEKRDLVSIMMNEEESIWRDEESKELKFKKDISPFSINDIKAMLICPNSVRTSVGIYYQLIENCIDNSDRLVANYLIYEKIESPKFRKT